MVAGSDHLSTMAGAHTVRIELVTGGRTRLDQIVYFEKSNSGIEEQPPTTWGRLKSLYR